jgi:polyhydroxyalkanoate synthase
VIVERIRGLKPGSCPHETVYEDWLFKLHRFRGEAGHRTPVLISYAFINRPQVLDLHEAVSVIRLLLEARLDVWMIDWSYPTLADRHLVLDDYVDFIENCVEIVRRERDVEALTLWGYCLGTTLAVVYTCLFPEKVRNLVIQTPPVNFDTQNTLAVWAKSIDPVKVSRAFFNASGDFLNLAFLLVDPVRLVVGKYQALLDSLGDEKSIKDFFYMDHWIFDSPAVPGKVFEEYITRWYHRNEIVRGEFTVKGRRVDLGNVRMPVLVLAANKDHITPPEGVLPFFEAIPSKDKKMLLSDKGHIGLTVSRSSHQKIWPEAIRWVVERSD